MADLTALIVEIPSSAPVAATYYGNAEPEGKTVIVGGDEVVVGGWAAYECVRRGAGWRSSPGRCEAEPRRYYGGRTYVSGQDAVESLVTARCRDGKGYIGGGSAVDPLEKSVERLASALDIYEKLATHNGKPTVWGRLGVQLDMPIVMSSVTADSLRAIISETDPAVLHRTAEDVGILASGYAPPDQQLEVPHPPRVLPPAPERIVPLRGKSADEINQSLVALEETSLPRATAIETYRGEVAQLLDAAAAILEKLTAK